MGRWLSGLMLLVMLPAQGLAEGSPHYLWFEYAAGGDELVDPDSGRSLRAGELIQISYGYKFFSEQLPQWRVDLRGGFKFWAIDIEGGDAVFYRFPLEVAFNRSLGDKFSLGFGATYHVNPSYRLEAGPVDDSIDFDNAFGGFLSAQYEATKSFAFGLRYLHIKYDKDGATFRLPNGDLEDEIDGTSTGVYMTYSF